MSGMRVKKTKSDQVKFMSVDGQKPMVTITLSYAKAHLSEIVTRCEEGEPFEITRGGRAVVLLVSAAILEEAHQMESAELPTGMLPQSLADLASGVLRPAPGEKDRFLTPMREGEIPQKWAEPEIIPAKGPKSTAGETSTPAQATQSPKPARSPASAPKPLTLADILKASPS